MWKNFLFLCKKNIKYLIDFPSWIYENDFDWKLLFYKFADTYENENSLL